MALPTSIELAFVRVVHSCSTYLETYAKEDIVQEEECNARFRHFSLVRVAVFLVEPDQNRNDQVTETLSSSSIHEHLSSAPSFNVGNSDGREQKVAHAVDCC